VGVGVGGYCLVPKHGTLHLAFLRLYLCDTSSQVQTSLIDTRHHHHHHHHHPTPPLYPRHPSSTCPVPTHISVFPSHFSSYASCIIRRLAPHNIYLPRQHGQPDQHGDSNNRQIDTGKLQAADMNVFARKDIAPQHASQRCAKRQTEGAVVHPNRHAVHGSPEGAVGDGRGVAGAELLPGLDDAREEDCSADVCACELTICE